MADKTAQSGNVVLTFTACASGGDTVPAGSTVLFRKTDAGTATVTTVTPGTVDGLAIADKTDDVDQNEVFKIKPGRVFYNPENDNRVSFTYSSEVGLEMAVYQ